MPTAEIIAIGTELLLGETIDTNTRFIARLLRSLGIDLFRTQIIGDNKARIAKAVREAAARADIIITTGGLGPTVDDPTRQAIADSTGIDLEYHPELWEEITAHIASYGRHPTENQKRQAYIPRGATVIDNPVGTAPAFILEFHIKTRGGKSTLIICLPGVPREMETLLTTDVVPYLIKRFGLNELIQVRILHVSGIGEAALDEKIGDLEILTNPTIGLTAHSGIVDIRIATKVHSSEEAQKLISPIEIDLHSRLGAKIFGADDETLEEMTLQALEKRDWTLTCLEVNLSEALLVRLSQCKSKSWLGGVAGEFQVETLMEEMEKIRLTKNASTALAVHLDQTGINQIVTIIVISPSGREEKKLTYGGHPGNASLWASNMALDMLLHIALETA